jgi:hypothetical protein
MPYLKSSDFHEPNIRAFISRECVDVRPDLTTRVRTRELYPRYVKFCAAIFVEHAPVTTFAKTLRGLGFSHMKSNYVMWCGLRLRQGDEIDSTPNSQGSEIGPLQATLIGDVSFEKFKIAELRWLVGFFGHLATCMPGRSADRFDAKEIFGPAVVAMAREAGDRMRREGR